MTVCLIFFFFQAEDGIRDYRSEEHTSELQSHDNLVCRLIRSEEHTSELQSHDNIVCRLFLEKRFKNDQLDSPSGWRFRLRAPHWSRWRPCLNLCGCGLFF